MKGIPMLKIDFPLVKTISGPELIEWYRHTMSPTLHTLKDLGTGCDFCYSLEMLFPGCIGIQRIKLDNPSIFDRRHNLKLLQSAFNSLRIDKSVPLQKLEQGNWKETYYFALWYKAFFEANYKGMGNGLSRFQVSLRKVKYRPRNSTTGGFTKIDGRCPSKETTEKDESVVLPANKKNDTSVTKSSLQRKRKRPFITERPNRPRLSTVSQLKQDEHKCAWRMETAEKQKVKVLLEEIKELEKVVENLSERIVEFEQRQLDYEEQIKKLRQLNEDLNKNPHDDSGNQTDMFDPAEMFDCSEAIKEENEEVAKCNDELRIQNLDLEIEINTMNQVVREQRRLIDDLTQEKDCTGGQITKLETIVCEQKQENRELKTAKEKQTSHIEKLQESVNTQMRQMEDLELIMNEQLRSLEDLTQRKDEQTKTIEDLEQTKHDMQLTINGLNKSNKAMDAHIRHMEQNYSDVLQQNDNLTKCNQDLACHFNDISKENRDLHQRNHRLAKNYETILCYSCSSAKLYFKQLVKIEKACKIEANSTLRKCINAILHQTKHHPPLAHGATRSSEPKANTEA